MKTKVERERFILCWTPNAYVRSTPPLCRRIARTCVDRRHCLINAPQSEREEKVGSTLPIRVRHPANSVVKPFGLFGGMAYEEECAHFYLAASQIEQFQKDPK